MKKRILSLFLCVLLLFPLASCAEEDPVLEYGTFYTENGLLQNTRVYLVITEDEMSSLLHEFSYELCNETSFSVRFHEYRKIECYRDGKWQEVPPSNTLSLDITRLPAPLAAGEKKTQTEYLKEDGVGDAAYDYAYLSMGLYRIVFSAYFEEADAYLEQNPDFYIVGYFEVY